jgi:hypothetical protein
MLRAAPLLALLLAACGGGRSDRMLVGSPAALDFGRVVYGDRETRTLVLENVSSERLLISGIKPNCSCFTLGPYLHTLSPGQKTEVAVTFHSGLTASGRLRGKTLQVISNDRLGGMLEVALEGESVEVRRIAPAQVDLTSVKWGEPVRLAVRPGPGVVLAVTSAEAVPPEPFAVEVAAAEAGADVLVRVRPDAPRSPNGLAELVIRSEVSGQGLDRRVFEDRVRIVGGW